MRVIALLLAGLVPVGPARAQAIETAQSAGAPAVDGAAGAETPPDSGDARARELYLRGDRLYAEGDYAAAIDAFKRAHDLSGRPLLLFNLANAHERAGRYDDALDALRKYAPGAPESEGKSISRRIEQLEKKVAHSAPAASAPPADTAVSASAPQHTAGPDPGSSEPAGVRLDSDDASTSTLGWVLTIGGGVLLVAGTAAGLLALDARAEAEQDCDGDICNRDAKDAVERDRTASLIADIGLVGGALSLTAGLVLLWALDSPAEADRARLWLDTDSVRVGYAGSF